MEYTIQQKATVWYETTVEAKTEEEALQKAASNDNDNWEMLLETVVFEDEYEIMDDN